MSTLKKIAVATALVFAATVSMAQSYGQNQTQNHQRHHGGGGNNWVAPALVAGLIGYGIANAQNQNQQQQYQQAAPTIVYPNGPVYIYDDPRYTPAPPIATQEAIYVERWVWNSYVNVWERKLVRVR